jgi:hypothetical protein
VPQDTRGDLGDKSRAREAGSERAARPACAPEFTTKFDAARFECGSRTAQRIVQPTLVSAVKTPTATPWLAALVIACSSTEQNPNAGHGSLVGELGANDVSILFPLPESGQIDQLLAPSALGEHGELLPRAVFEHAPELTLYADKAGQYDVLRVVSARVDPCFPSLVGAPSPSCRFQVRLVLQPIYEDTGQVYAEDAAVHVFYDLPSGDFIELLSDLLELREHPLQAPLSVQPTIASEGLSGPYATALRAAFLSKLGAARLTRMTFMQLGGERNAWTFGGFDLTGGTATPVAILASTVTEQTFSNDTIGDPLSFSGDVSPALAGAPEDLSPLYDSATASQAGDVALFALYESILRIENPDRHSPESVDCVSCHTAQPARLWLERNTALATQPSAERYTSAFDLTVDPIDDTTSVLRSFGWFETRPAITARVAHESAAVASYLNERVLARP